MITLVVNIIVNTGKVPEFISETRKLQREVKSFEPRCKQYDMLMNNKNSNNIMLIETYEDSDAINFHKECKHFKEWREKVRPMTSEFKVLSDFTKI